MTAWEIGLIVAIKGGIVGFLAYKGWWPDWEARARKREEHKRVLLAYEEWRSRTGARGASNAGVVEDPVADPSQQIRPIR
jgi:hypothetical protein